MLPQISLRSAGELLAWIQFPSGFFQVQGPKSWCLPRPVSGLTCQPSSVSQSYQSDRCRMKRLKLWRRCAKWSFWLLTLVKPKVVSTFPHGVHMVYTWQSWMATTVLMSCAGHFQSCSLVVILFQNRKPQLPKSIFVLPVAP